MPPRPPAGFENLNPVFASRLQAMIAAAAAEGVTIGVGSGYRTIEEQIALRKKNGCPDVWKSPASSCRVPTAIPGRSNHNHGLAADITGDKAWANRNAHRFGLVFNVSGEDWHVELADDDEARGVVDGFPEAIGFDAGWMEEARNPQDELADRLHAVMRIIGSATPPVEVPEDMLDPELRQDTTVLPSETGGTAPAGDGDGGPGDPNGYGAHARSLMDRYGWSEDDYEALVELWNRESGDPKAGAGRVTWNPLAQNPASTAFGIAQFLDGTWEGTGFQKTVDPRKQIEAGLAYIAGRYGSPRRALLFHNRNNWY